MFILDRRHFLALTGAALAVPAPGLAAPARADVFTGDQQTGAAVDSVVVVGEDGALLIDAQFNAENAGRLADAIAATGKPLQTVILSHYHPDHVLGLGTILTRFPEARVVAHAQTQPGITEMAAPMLAEAGITSANAIPEAIDADHVMFEGERIELIGPLHGDTPLITAVHIPALDTLVGADLLFADTHLWVRENTMPENIAKWRESLDLLEGIGAGTVVPGHRKEASANDASVFTHTRAYLDQWETALATAGSAEELMAMMMEGNEDLGLAFALQVGVQEVFPS